MKLSTTDPVARAHSEKLSHYIHQEIIHSGGFITFARFMQLVLYAPGLGYYSAGKYKFGREGDFVTAPEISPLFAKCIAKQSQTILEKIPQADIVELGAGSGIFAKDLLLALEQLNSLPIHYFILEVSAELREQQKKLFSSACPHLLSRIHWLDSLPMDVQGIIFANEVMDALPTHCFRIEKNQVKERCVIWQEDHFAWQSMEPTTPELKQAADLLLQNYSLCEGYESEINLMLAPWITSITQSLKQGVILLCDYGYGRAEYYHPDRTMGTLQCYYQHHYHADPFVLLGLQDMTAHVDFTTVIESASQVGCALLGYTTQAAFLLACGILQLAEIENAFSIEQYQQSQSIKQLILPSQMGELIKIMALGKNFSGPLVGFSLQDRSRDL